MKLNNKIGPITIPKIIQNAEKQLIQNAEKIMEDTKLTTVKIFTEFSFTNDVSDCVWNPNSYPVGIVSFPEILGIHICP